MDAEKALDAVLGNNYNTRLDHPILNHYGVFYLEALYNDLIFELTLASALQVVKGSDASTLVYKLTNIQLKYETVDSKKLADVATSVYNSGKAFAYDHIMREEVTFAKATDNRLNIRVNPERLSFKSSRLLFIEPYTAGTRDSEKYVNPNITKVTVAVKGSPNKIYNNETEAQDLWQDIAAIDKHVPSKMAFTMLYTDNNFGLLIDLRSMADTTMHGSGVKLVNTNDGVFLEVDRKTSGSRNVKCHFFTISNAQMNLLDRQLVSVEY